MKVHNTPYHTTGTNQNIVLRGLFKEEKEEESSTAVDAIVPQGSQPMQLCVLCGRSCGADVDIAADSSPYSLIA